MSVEDLLNQFEIEGALCIKKWNSYLNDMEILYETDDHQNDLYGCGEEWMYMNIAYMYPTTKFSNETNTEIPQIVIEIES